MQGPVKVSRSVASDVDMEESDSLHIQTKLYSPLRIIHKLLDCLAPANDRVHRGPCSISTRRANLGFHRRVARQDAPVAYLPWHPSFTGWTLCLLG